MQYSLLALISTIIGAVVGVGGGLIIRPMLGIMGVVKSLAAFSSAITVLSMAVVSLFTVIKKGAKIELAGTLLFACGSIVGGFLGGSLLDFANETIVDIGYVVAMVLVLTMVLVRDKFHIKPVKNPILQVLIGLSTGILSGFFGIGGGPFQMTALLVFFKLNAKDAAVQSIFVTFLTTISSLIRYGMNGYTDFSLAIYMIPAAILGGLLGGLFNRKLSSETVTKLFNITVIAIIIVQIYSLVGIH